MPPSHSSTSLRILVVDDEINIRKTLTISLETDGHQVVAVSNGRDALAEAARQSFDLAFVDLKLGSTSGLDLSSELIAQSPWLRVVIITAHGSIDSAVETMKRGAADYLTKPFTPAQVKLVTERVARIRTLEQQVAGLEAALGQPESEIVLKSDSLPMQRAISLARQVATSEATVLIRGESGTGKGVIARAIHGWSTRASKPFATVSAPTLSAQLLESELFGHAKGAFTGAIRDNPGRIAACDGGTLFLDEIGDMPLALQPKLLRFVQDRVYERVGEATTRRADVRMITATNVDLDEAVRAGTFREDLFYRIKVIQIDIPPLRERAEDAVSLATQFFSQLSAGKTILGFSDEVQDAFRKYAWPGNVRELRNVVERAVILCQTEKIGIEHLPENFKPSEAATPQVGDAVSLDSLEELHIRRVLARTKSLDEAAEVLGIDVATLWRRRKKYGI
ncbi:MAG TPA: sigma-54 dependent transcriptional regulator [Tepidisphaeraceae bacterium]|jgi:NtrC-family two-component system response regulator AlgB|nr:sigma-54 dependent transcriptional regulator [Tepidisphaeraceae bacterium]